MTYVVCEPCIKCKYTDCVDVCPVDCFVDGANFLAIDPEECIDCGACVPECPTEAIFEETEVPEKWNEYVKINEELTDLWENIDSQKEPLLDAHAWNPLMQNMEGIAVAADGDHTITGVRGVSVFKKTLTARLGTGEAVEIPDGDGALVLTDTDGCTVVLDFSGWQKKKDAGFLLIRTDSGVVQQTMEPKDDLLSKDPAEEE